MTANGIVSGPGVVSVNDQTGVAVLTAANVAADPAGSAATAQAAAQTFATNAANAALTAANAATTAAIAAALASIAPGAWIGTSPTPNAALIELAAAWTPDVSGTYFTASMRQGAYGRLEGSGRLNTSSAYTGGTQIFLLPTALRPTANIVLDVRIGGVGAAAAFLTIATTGVGSLSASFGAGASWLQLDPIGARRTT